MMEKWKLFAIRVGALGAYHEVQGRCNVAPVRQAQRLPPRPPHHPECAETEEDQGGHTKGEKRPDGHHQRVGNASQRSPAKAPPSEHKASFVVPAHASAEQLIITGIILIICRFLHALLAGRHPRQKVAC